jgi:Spy/CpxP family protein refolding chaperone
MRKHTVTFLIALPLLTLGGPVAWGGNEAVAQMPMMGEGEGVERHLARLKEELDLTDQQVAELRPILEAKHEQFQALHDTAPEDREARREEFRQLWAEARASVNEVLTDEQEARLEELHESRGHHGFKGGGFHGPPDPERHLTRLREELDLTDAQVAELRTIFEEQHGKFEALHESAPEDREARHEAFQALREETHERLSQVLTEEQRQRFEELKRSHEGHRGPRGDGHRGS